MDPLLKLGAPMRNGVHLLSDPTPFEIVYERVRSAEGRMLTDEQVARLPDGTGLWNASEWRIRARSADRLAHALNARGHTARILDVGCGNGWLSARLQEHGHQVVGIDSFTAELEQAARVFPGGPEFARADLFRSGLPERYFDVVLFAASIQYFPEPRATMARAFELLDPGGEVHVMDSILYRSPVEAEAARVRSRAHYSTTGVPEMAGHYYAHELISFQSLGHLRILSTPSGMDRTLQRFGRQASPFTHVVISLQ